MEVEGFDGNQASANKKAAPMLSHYCSIITSLVSYLELFSFFVMFINSSFIWMIIFIYCCIYTSEFYYLVDENCYAVRLIFIRGRDANCNCNFGRNFLLMDDSLSVLIVISKFV